ncbi:NAD-dependent epimerase/dehydratase family protein [Maribacter sp. MJ134]|uniref:SDR family oxidoreductase n=1 Tax=Maribacter sp. MJ134 TaxID=2496865 RepID=UPI000F833A73|nr:SDR family oxidoreductase [Maribacter sp. MJ134]AZQ60090.1 NAD-dependent epimerase/dehydratase family protein [Maribacter sp. MJ134]
MQILLTGATGTLGSQILFSLLEEKFTSIQNIYLPVRDKKSVSSKERIRKMLQSDFAPKFIKNNLTAIRAKITVVSAKDMLYPERFLNEERITHFIHSAGFVNLSTSPDAKDEIFRENYDFTKSIFEAYAKYIDKFIYISTAFSAGNVGGLLKNDYLQTAPTAHRNHYEASKYASEKYLTQAGAAADIPVQILRPSVLGGNIMDTPNFFISKYMVFYLFAKFFHRNTSADTVRITAHSESGLNIIPTDYAAKVIVAVLDTAIDQLNIVHSKTTHITKGITKILETVAFDNFSITQNLVNTTSGFESKLEQFYYDTIGVHLTPYLTSEPCEWDTTLLQQILPMPTYNLNDYLGETIKFAKINGFKNQQW